MSVTLTEIASVSRGISESIRIAPTVLRPGSSVTYYFGAAAPEGDSHTLTEQFMFDDELSDEGVGVYTESVEYFVTCWQRLAVFDAASGNPLRLQQQPDESGSSAEVTRTFELTLRGEAPAGETFGVEQYAEGDPPGQPIRVFLLCGDAPKVVVDDVPDCRGGGVTFKQQWSFPSGERIKIVFFRLSENPPREENFYRVTETLDRITETTLAAFAHSVR